MSTDGGRPLQQSLSFPLIISQNLPFALATGEDVVSILLSNEDLAKLDLTSLKLFPVDTVVLREREFAKEEFSQQVCCKETLVRQEDPRITYPHPHSGQNAEPVRESFLDVLKARNASDDDFSFEAPLLINPSQDLRSASISISVLKSKAVIEAEKAMKDIYPKDLFAPGAQEKAMSMDELTLNLQCMNNDSDEQDDSGITGSPITVNSKASLTAVQITKPELVETAHKAEALRKKHVQRMLSRTFSRVWEEARIDLDASPATKFLLQVMPWELTPPLTPAKTPAAVPFLWEETPGKPKTSAIPSSFPALQLPPRLLAVPPGMSDRFSSCQSHFSGKRSTFSDADYSVDLHRKNSHSWHPLQNLLSTNRYSSEENSAVVDKTDEDPFPVQPSDSPSEREFQKQIDSPISTLYCPEGSCSSSSLSNQSEGMPSDSIIYEEHKFMKHNPLPSPYTANFTPLTSPYRDLGPTSDDIASNSRGLKAFVKTVYKGSKWPPWMKRNKNKNCLPTAEPWAPTLATYFHRLEQRKRICENKDSHLEDGKGQYLGGVTRDNISTEKRNKQPLNYEFATGRHSKDQVKQEEAISEDQLHCREMPSFEFVHPMPVPRSRKGGRRARSRILGRLRRTTRLFVAALRRSVFRRKVYQRKLLGDSRLLH